MSDSEWVEDGETEQGAQEAAWQYPNAGAWVDGWLVKVIQRPMRGGKVWCAQWWKHPEAVCRLHALWLAWESSEASDDPTGPAYWWVYYLNPMLADLTDEAGPFGGCLDGHNSGTRVPFLQVMPPDDGYEFDEELWLK